MKKFAIIFSFVFANIIISNTYGQTSKPIFVFDNKEVISKHFSDKTNNKIINFKIRGLNNKNDISQLKENISNYRGVINFTIDENPVNNEYNATIELYKYADHWMYYKYLFIRNNVSQIIFGDKTVMSENLTEK